MRKVFCLALVLVLAFAFSGCKPGETPPVDTLSGGAEHVLKGVLSGANNLLGQENALRMSFESQITDVDSENSLGLTADEFSLYAEEAYVSTAAIMTHAHQIAIVKCKDASSAAEVKKLIASGFNTEKWICVFPEQCFVVESGSYVLMAATYTDSAEAIKESFSTLANGNVGSMNVFYTK